MLPVTGGAFVQGSPEWILSWLQKERQSFPREWFTDETARFSVDVAPFWIDRFPVTVGQFRDFVHATGYESDAERSGRGMVYGELYWEERAGVSWRRPDGLTDNVDERRDHPVVNI